MAPTPPSPAPPKRNSSTNVCFFKYSWIAERNLPVPDPWIILTWWCLTDLASSKYLATTSRASWTLKPITLHSKDTDLLNLEKLVLTSILGFFAFWAGLNVFSFTLKVVPESNWICAWSFWIDLISPFCLFSICKT